MEIEAKFAVPDQTTYDRLAACQELAGFSLAAGPTVQNRDQYVDTPDRRVLAGGYACRLRQEGDSHILTLKSLQGGGSAVHRRDEREARLPSASLDPAGWPDSPARALVIELTGGAPLGPLVALEQRRARRNVQDADRHVGEFTLDAVEVAAPGADAQRYFELEIELKDAGTEADLERLADTLRRDWQLAPEPRSKFERALTALDARARPAASGGRRRGPVAPDGPPLSAEERSILERYAAAATRPLARRAEIVLGWAAGLPTGEVAGKVGLSTGRVRHWLRLFRRRRMDIFARATRQGRAGPGSVEAADAGQPPAVDGGAPAEAQAPAGNGSAPAEVREPETAAGKQDKGGQAAPEQEPPTVAPEDAMAEAGRKIMNVHYRRMVEHEDGTRKGEDPEDLHDMRVATRRMRAAFVLFEPYYEPKTVKRFNKRLKNTGRMLGAVRDLDVLLEKAEKYQAEHQAAGTLQPVLDSWREQREDARQKMLAFLDDNSYRRFRDDFGDFLNTPGAGALPVPAGQPIAYQVRHVMPRLLLARYEDVRAYEPLLPDVPLATYHQLRITCKKLRYAMEFFREVLGDGANSLIKRVTSMQDLLGDLHDASVAEGLVADFLADQVRQHSQALHQASLDGVVAYLAAQWDIQRNLLGRFPALWNELNGYEFRKGLSLAVATL